MTKIDDGGDATVRTQLVSSQDLIDRVNAWRGRQPGVPSKSAAIRQLIERALVAEERV